MLVANTTLLHLYKMEQKSLRLTVVVPTYKRPDDLVRCIANLKSQLRSPDQIIVVAHESDQTSIELVREEIHKWDKLLLMSTAEKSVVRAMYKGLLAADGDVVAFIDDDTAPTANWSSRIMQYFENDDTIGGVGGRDRIVPLIKYNLPMAKSIGIIRWWGHLDGEHHRGCMDARDVDFLKGANMAFRRHLLMNLEWPMMLRGGGAETHHEIYICLRIKAINRRIIYDPEIIVDHFISERKAGINRGLSSAAEYRVDNYNLAVALQILPVRKKIVCSMYVMFRYISGAVREFVLRGNIRGATARLAGADEFVRALMIK